MDGSGLLFFSDGRISVLKSVLALVCWSLGSKGGKDVIELWAEMIKTLYYLVIIRSIKTFINDDTQPPNFSWAVITRTCNDTASVGELFLPIL